MAEGKQKVDLTPILLAGIIGVAMVLRIIYLIELSSTPFFRHPILDAEYYFGWGTKLAQGGFRVLPGFQGNPDCVDPEEAFVGALSSCHMLTFLAIAAKKRLTVDRYEDNAVGTLEKNTNGRLAVTRATLRPKVVWGGDKTPTLEEIGKMHEHAHRACFIANSVLTEVSIESR